MKRTVYTVKPSDMSSYEYYHTRHTRPYQSHSAYYDPAKPSVEAPTQMTASQQRAAKVRAKEREAIRDQRNGIKVMYRAMKQGRST